MMQRKTNLFHIAALLIAVLGLGGIALYHPAPPEARAADDLFDELIGDGSKIMAVPMQIGRDTFGLAMIDTANQTLWIYEITNRKPGFSQLRLMAARSWEYDRKLKEFNSGEPSPQYIRTILEGAQSTPSTPVRPQTNTEP